MLKLLGKENIRKEEFTFIHAALVPRADGMGPALRLPTVWDFEDPNGYFRGVVVRKLRERAMRVWWDHTHKATVSQPRKQGEGPEDTGKGRGKGAPDDTREGAAPWKPGLAGKPPTQARCDFPGNMPPWT
eukprot:15135973-Heterocapsa_arctica.AAC.1